MIESQKHFKGPFAAVWLPIDYRTIRNSCRQQMTSVIIGSVDKMLTPAPHNSVIFWC